MDRRQLGLKLVMVELDLPVQVESFDDRLILQKAIYLAQAAGVNLGYYYRWYLRGPYCPAVAEDGFAVSSEGADESRGWKLDDSSLEKLNAIHRMLEEVPYTDLARRLELLASVHYLVDRRQGRGRDPQEISETLQKFNKQFSKDEVTSALGELTSNGILSR